MKTIEFTDKSGRQVKPGDLIVYGHALGRCAGLQYGKALAIHYVEKSEYDYEKREHVPIRYAHLTVQGVDQDWNHAKAKLLRKGTLQFGSRTLVISRDQIPTEALALLDAVEVPS